MALSDPRRLARVSLVEEYPTLTNPIAKLGFDPHLQPPASAKELKFADPIRTRRCPIKSLLLDQSYMAGIGNWMADEILYQARIHPQQVASTLNEEQVEKLLQSLLLVVSTSVATLADAKKFPEDWLFHRRWFKGKKKLMTTVDGLPITHVTVIITCDIFVFFYNPSTLLGWRKNFGNC